jgi:hypothetical protein
MTDANREVIVAIPKKKLSAEENARKRAERAELCLGYLVSAAKSQTDPGTWLNFGLLEAEAYLNAIATGTRHPLIKLYEDRANERGAGNPSFPSNEQHARRLIVLGCIALHRAGLGKHAARQRIAKKIESTNLFLNAPSATALDHWERDGLPLMPWDQALLARCLDRCGIKNLEAIADYFVGLAHSMLNPSAVVVLDARETPL